MVGGGDGEEGDVDSKGGRGGGERQATEKKIRKETALKKAGCIILSLFK